MRSFLRRTRRLLKELKRRKVYRAAAFYCIVVVGGLELADLLVPATRLPDWADELLVALAVVGLPLVVVLAWMFDITEEGVARTGDEEPGGEATKPRSPMAQGAAPPAGGSLDPTVVAVLPFENLTGSTRAEPFVVGLHDDLLTELSRASALSVISRGSVRAYRDAGRSTREVARELGAGTVVQGGVQMVGDRVRLNIQVSDAGSDAHRWAERYDRQLTAENVFALQSELAARIMAELEMQLTPEEAARTSAPSTRDLGAYRLCVRGRSLLERWSGEDVRQAASHFQEALEFDPEYALAWAGLAEALSLVRWYNLPEVPGAPTPEEAAQRALELNPVLAEAHLSWAIVRASREHTDAPGALEALERAVTYQPSLATAWIWTSWLHLMAGRPSQAVEPGERAVELDPLQAPARVFLADAYLASGRPGDAVEQAQRGRSLQPDHGLAHLMEGLAFHHMGSREEAERALEAALAILPPEGQTPTPVQVRAVRAAIGVKAGRTEEGTAFLEEEGEEADSISLGLVLAALGRHDDAMAAFLRTERWDQISTSFARYLFPEILAPLRRDPAFDRLLHRIDRAWGVSPG